MATLLAEAGATVLIMGRNVDTLRAVADSAADLRGRIVPFVGDVTRDGDVLGALDTLRTDAGGVFGWVNNAYSGAGGRLLKYTRDELETTTRSMADVMMATQQAAQHIIDSG